MDNWFPARYSASFEKFWQAYPCKQDKGNAFKAFQEAVKRAPLAEIMAGVERYKGYLHANPTKPVKFAQGWLNGDRWTDEYAAPQSDTSWRVSAAVEQTLRRRMQ